MPLTIDSSFFHFESKAFMRDDIIQAKITTKPRFEKQPWWKEYPRENITKKTKVWENVTKTRLGGAFWACYVIAHKTY